MVRAGAGIVGSALALHAAAQATSAGGVLQTVPGAPPPAARPDGGPVVAPQPARAIGDIEGLNIDVKGFRITGLSVMPEADAQAVLSAALGPGKNFQALLDAATLLKQHLVGAGYLLTDVIVPEQKIRDGIVELHVLEGRLGKVRVEVAEGTGVSAEFLQGFVSGLEEGAVITTAAIERAAFLLSDLRGITVRTVLQPGAQVGTADFVVQAGPADTLSGTVGADANGSIYTGVFRGNAGVDLNNPFGWGDLISARYTKSLDQNNLDFARLSYLTPLGTSGLKVGVAYADLKYRLGTPVFEPLKANGTANVKTAMAIYPLVRSRNVNVMLNAQYDAKKLRDRQDGVGIKTYKDANTTLLGVSGDIRDTLLGGGITTYNLGYTTGKLTFLDSAVAAGDAAGLRTAGGYTKTNISASRLQSILPRLALFLNYSQQFASKNLDSSEKFSLGGANGVRAYPVGEGSGDEGWLANIELRWRLEDSEDIPGTMVLTAFHDVGGTRLNKNPIPGGASNKAHVAGYGVGINWESAGSWSLNGSIAIPLDGPPAAEHVKRDPRLLVTFTKYF